MLYKFLGLLFFFAAIFFAIHYYIEANFFANAFFYEIWQIYVFLVSATVITVILVGYVQKVFPDKTGFTFMGLSLIKMAAAIVFFIPLLESEVEDRTGDILNFFIPYFLFLIFEVIYLVRLINRN